MAEAEDRQFAAAQFCSLPQFLHLLSSFLSAASQALQTAVPLESIIG